MPRRVRSSRLTPKLPSVRKAPPKFRMKGRPTKPKRGSWTRTIPIASGDTLDKVLANLEKAGVNPSEATFQVRESDNYGCNCWSTTYSDDVEVVYEEPESDGEWELRLATYRKRLASWEEWAENHKEEIEARAAEETEKKEMRVTRNQERHRNSLERERKIVEKRLENLNKRLQK